MLIPLAACLVAAVLVSLRLLRPDMVSDDALVHQYWMLNWRDPELFTDPLTAELRGSTRYPDGYELLFRLAVRFFDPIVFGEWLGIALMAFSAWLVFLIVREHTDWRPAAWIAAGLFLALINIHRFHGGFPRAFVHPVVLSTVLLSLRDRQAAAALVAAGGALLYPPAALLTVGVLAFSAIVPRLDRRRAGYAVIALALAAAAALAADSPRVFSAAEARAFPEFGPRGALHFFADSPLTYLRQNRSGFDLQGAGSVLVLATLALLPVSIRRLRREVIALPVVALGAYALAQAVLFRLYLPHRYTYPLVAFCAIAVAVALRPTWEAAGTRARTLALACLPLAAFAAGVYAFPLGPLADAVSPVALALVAAAGAGALAAALRGRALAAAATGAALIVALLAVPDRSARGSPCPRGPVARYLATLPKDAVIAGDPYDLKCVVATARRAVVISSQLSPAYEVDYFLGGRERMFADLRAYYGPSLDALADLRRRYGATHLWVRRHAVAKGGRWRPQRQPYGSYVHRLLRAGEPAVLRLPVACRRWRLGGAEVYDVACVTRVPDGYGAEAVPAFR